LWNGKLVGEQLKEKNNIWKWLGTSSVTQEKRSLCTSSDYITFNPLNAELNLICHLLTLLGAHTVLHVSRITVN